MSVVPGFQEGQSRAYAIAVIIRLSYTGVAAPLLVCLGAYFVAIERYGLAQICFVVAGIWGTIWLWTLALDHLKPSARLLSRATGTIAIGAICLMLVKETAGYRLERELALDHGTLEPAGESNPDSMCPIMPNSFAIFMGPKAFSLTKFPNTFITMGKDAIIILDRDKENKRLKIVLLRIYDDRGLIIAKIENNEFTVLNGAQKKSPDKSTLIVYDHLDHEVLKFHYINENALSILGTFRYPGVSPIRMTKENSLLGYLAFRLAPAFMGAG